MDKQEQSYLERLVKLTDSIKNGAEITQELKREFGILAEKIGKIDDTNIIPVLLRTFMSRDDAFYLNCDIYLLLSQFYKKTTPYLIEALSYENNESRAWSLALLRRLISGGLEKGNFDHQFSKMLKDPDPNVRYEALLSLAILSDEPKRYLGEELLNDPLPKVREFATKLYQDRAEALLIPLKEMISVFEEGRELEIVNPKDFNDIDDIIKTLGKIRSIKSIPYLLNLYLINDEEIGFNNLIIDTLEVFTDEELIPYLLQTLETGTEGGKAVSLLLLGTTKNPRFIENIRPFLRHENEEMRITAVKAMGVLNDSAANPYLMEVVKTDPSSRVREEAEIALEIIAEGLD